MLVQGWKRPNVAFFQTALLLVAFLSSALSSSLLARCGPRPCQTFQESGPLSYSVFFANNQHAPPSSSCNSKMCLALIEEIERSADSIDFAIYGLRNQEAIVEALVNAKNRGVKVRGVVDSQNRYCGAKGKYMYGGTSSLIEKLGGRDVVHCDNGIGHSYIMHNKFFIFDQKSVWTGSTNVSDKGVGGENHANASILLSSPKIAKIYTRKFDDLYLGLNHRFSVAYDEQAVIWDDGSQAEVAFAPSDNPSLNLIAPHLDLAKSSISVGMFFLTDEFLSDRLIAAKERGLAVRIILDSSGAASVGSQYQRLCDHGVEIKIENWSHKMHMKLAVLDPDLNGNAGVLLGSQNWTQSGNQQNDENTIYIRNHGLSQESQQEFERLWSDLDEVQSCRPLKVKEKYLGPPRRSLRLMPKTYRKGTKKGLKIDPPS